MENKIVGLHGISRFQYLAELGGGCYDLVSLPRSLRNAKLLAFSSEMKQKYQEGGWEVTTDQDISAGQMVCWQACICGIDVTVRILGWVSHVSPAKQVGWQHLRIKPHFIHRLDLLEADLSKHEAPGYTPGAPSLEFEFCLAASF